MEIHLSRSKNSQEIENNLAATTTSVEELVNEVWNILLFSILLFSPLQVSKTRRDLISYKKVSFSYMEPKGFLKNYFAIFAL